MLDFAATKLAHGDKQRSYLQNTDRDNVGKYELIRQESFLGLHSLTDGDTLELAF